MSGLESVPYELETVISLIATGAKIILIVA